MDNIASELKSIVAALVGFLEHHDVLITASAALITALATVFIAVFTLTLKLSTDKLWSEGKSATKAAQKSADAAQKSADAAIGAERAWLLPVLESDNFRDAIERAKVYGFGEPRIATDDPPKVRFRFKNYGRTPGFVRHISFGLQHWTEFPTEPSRYSPEIPFPRNDIIGPGGTVPPGDREPFERILASSFDCDAASSVEKGHSALWFFGRIVYDDVWGNVHFTTFCRTYRGLVGGFVPYGGRRQNERT